MSSNVKPELVTIIIVLICLVIMTAIISLTISDIHKGVEDLIELQATQTAEAAQTKNG